MLRADDLQLGEQTFQDPVTQASFYSCVLRGNGTPATCQFIPETESSISLMAECMNYCDVSPNFLKCHGYGRENYPEGSFVLVVTEPVEYNLAVDLQRRIAEGRRYSEEEIKAIAKTCIESLAVFWRRSVADQGHGNLTPSSVFMTKEGIYKLGSFNSALAFKKDQTPYACYLHTRVGKGQVTKVEADLYATGILIYQLCALDCQGGPAFNTSEVHLRKGWADLQYQDYHLGETWFELMKVNRTGATEERIRKLVNLSQNFSVRVLPASQASSFQKRAAPTASQVSEQSTYPNTAYPQDSQSQLSVGPETVPQASATQAPKNAGPMPPSQAWQSMASIHSSGASPYAGQPNPASSSYQPSQIPQNPESVAPYHIQSGSSQPYPGPSSVAAPYAGQSNPPSSSYQQLQPQTSATQIPQNPEPALPSHIQSGSSQPQPAAYVRQTNPPLSSSYQVQYQDPVPQNQMMDVDPGQRECKNCRASQTVSSRAVGFICRICLQVST